MFEKDVLNTLYNSASFVIFLLPSLRMIFSPLDGLFVKKGTSVLHMVLLFVTLEVFRFLKYCFFVLFKSFLQ